MPRRGRRLHSFFADDRLAEKLRFGSVTTVSGLAHATTEQGGHQQIQVRTDTA